MGASHIAHGLKSDIATKIQDKKIPKNCLIITKVDDAYEQEELFYYDNNRSLHPISTKTIFNSLDDAKAWVDLYYKKGSVIAVKEDDAYHVYVVTDDNELILIDGSDKVKSVTSEDGTVAVGGSAIEPTVAVVIDDDNAHGLKASENGIYISEATQTESGAMSADDKAKLDDIESGAEVNVIRTIASGIIDGSISVNGIDVPITGLGSAAFTSKNDYQPAGTGMNYSVVESLPEVGQTDTIYLTKNKGEENNVFDEWLYVDEQFELVGTTKTDLSDYYVKEDVDNLISQAKQYADSKDVILTDDFTKKISEYVKSASLAKVATTGSYNDLSDKPLFPVVVEPVKRTNGSYYGSITFYAAKEILKAGLPLAVHWEPNSMIYYCTSWNDSRTYLTFSVQDYSTNRMLKWDKITDKIEESASTSLATTEQTDSINTTVTSLTSTVNSISSDVQTSKTDISNINTFINGLKIDLELDPSTYVVTAKLYDSDNNVVSTSTPIDLPIETLVVGAAYENKSIVITLKNGETITVPIDDVISGLVTETELDEYVAVDDDTIVFGG